MTSTTTEKSWPPFVRVAEERELLPRLLTIRQEEVAIISCMACSILGLVGSLCLWKKAASKIFLISRFPVSTLVTKAFTGFFCTMTIVSAVLYHFRRGKCWYSVEVRNMRMPYCPIDHFLWLKGCSKRLNFYGNTGEYQIYESDVMQRRRHNKPLYVIIDNSIEPYFKELKGAFNEIHDRSPRVSIILIQRENQAAIESLFQSWGKPPTPAKENQ